MKAYFRHEKRKETRKHEQIGPNMPMQFPKIGHRLFRRAATRWFEIHAKIAECMRLLFRQVEHPRDEIVPAFLNACQMFESFHRATRDAPYARKAQYDRWLQAMVAAIPKGVKPDHRQALKTRLKYGNQLSLRNRLKRTFEKLPEVIREKLEIKPADDAHKIAGARNFYIHLDDSDGGPPVEEGELFPYYAKLVMTVGYLLWCDLGLAKKVRPNHVLELWMLS